MFSALADDDDEPQQQQKTVQQKKPVQQAQPKPQEQRPKTAKPLRTEDLADFDGVTGQETRTRGGARGGRGGRGGFRGERGGARGGFRGGERREGEEGAPRRGRGEYRGGRGGRGERREGEEGNEPRAEGDRPRGRGRGRGRGRPQGEGATVEGDEGVLYVDRKEKVDFQGKEEHFQGKKNEKWHPFDRRSGTGRGRDVAKGGHGKGNWGKPADEVNATEGTEPVVGGEETKVQATPTEEGADAQPKEEEVEERRPREEPVEEEEEKGLTLQEFLAQKKSAGIRKEARKPEEVKKAGIEKVEKQADRVNQINSSLRDRDLYATGKAEGADLMGFQGGDDDFPREERSGRGGRRGGRGGARGGRGGNVAQGSRPQRGGQLRVVEEDFPTLG